MEEVWKDIIGYEGLYQVSNLGRVRSVDRQSFDESKYNKFDGQILKIRKNRNGYLYVILCRNGAKYYKYVHRLVAFAFVANDYNKKEVDHVDSDRSNNTFDNLRWVTHKENMNNTITRNKVLRFNKRVKESHRRIIKYTLNMEVYREYDCINDACYNTGYDYSTIKKCCDGHRKTAYGFIWRYI